MNENPHANKDGSPKDGEEMAFLEWRYKQYEKELEKLSPAERKKRIEAEKHIQNKMQS